MRYMNDFDLDYAVSRFIRASKPNRLALALVVRQMAEWTNDHSDGWAHWLPPRKACDGAMSLIESTTHEANERQEREDITDEQMLAAVKPIKAFLTRQKVDAERKEIILRAVSS